MAKDTRWPAYAAAGWALAFALMSFYWGLGGTIGLATLGVEIERLARSGDPTVTLFGAWIPGLAKLLAAVLALGLVQSWGRKLPRWMMLLASWGAGILLTLYSLANFIQHGLFYSGAIPTAAGLGEAAVPWHLFLWDPFWLLGGVLFCLAAWNFARRSRSNV